MKLYAYWRSQATFRVRIALNLKGLKAETIELDLLKGDQFADDYRQLNPQMVVPTLIEGDEPPLVQSLAILEYLEERYPQPPILPRDLRERAYVRALAATLAADSHPLVVPRVRNYLANELHLDGPAVLKWMAHWLGAGLTTLEAHLVQDKRMGRCCLGDTPTVADLCLVPQVTTCKILPGFDFTAFPKTMQIFDHCMGLDAFRAAAPVQPK